jgi:hypothetical protein
LCLAEDADGRRWAWLAPGPPPAPGTPLDAPLAFAQPCPASLSDDQAIEALCDWPAWRLTRLAGLEIGSGLLVAGDDALARRVLRVAHVRGCLWRAVHGAPALREAADRWIDPGARTAEAVLKALPARPDAAVVVCADVGRLVAALGASRDRGTVVFAFPGSERVDLDLYPDAHRRGLRIVGSQPDDAESGPEWAHAASRLLALQAAGVLTAR